MAHNIDTALLRAFVAVAETGGMTSAGRLLNLTQAAVSQQVKRLEDMFRQQLFHRDRRRLRLTAKGERLLAHAQRLLAFNDEVWGLMTRPDFEGEVRLGVPHDIVNPFMPPVLKSFDQAWPRVRVSLVCDTTPCLMAAMDRGEIDLTLTTERDHGNGAEMLLPDELVWVGARGGRAHRLQPLPVSLGNHTCAFRQTAVTALAGIGRDWRPVCEISNMEPIFATLRADLAVSALQVSTVPEDLQVLGAETGLPALPMFYINLHLPKAGAVDVAVELARHIRRQIANRHHSAA